MARHQGSEWPCFLTQRLHRRAASARACRGQGQSEESSGVFTGPYCGMTGPKCPGGPKAVEVGIWVLELCIPPGLQPSAFTAEGEPPSDHPHPQEWPRAGTPLRQPGGHQGTVPAQRAESWRLSEPVHALSISPSVITSGQTWPFNTDSTEGALGLTPSPLLSTSSPSLSLRQGEGVGPCRRLGSRRSRP